MKKLAEMNSVELSNVLCAIAEPAANLFSDDAVSKAFANAVKAREQADSPMHFFTQCLSIFAPLILGDAHRDDVFAIIAAIKGVDVDAIRAQNGMKTVQEVVQMLTGDRDLFTFFRNSEGHKTA